MKISLKKGQSTLRWVSQLMHGERREWDDEILRQCFLPHDATEVRKTRLSDRGDDMITWFYERTGLFTVPNAYRLAMDLEQKETGQERCSANPDGSRPLYKNIWTVNMPPKVRVFAWRVAKDSLATQADRKRRTLVQHATCQVCVKEDKIAHHAVVRCPKAGVLQHAMREVWSLPKEE
jgi:hypothetical protein